MHAVAPVPMMRSSRRPNPIVNESTGSLGSGVAPTAGQHRGPGAPSRATIVDAHMFLRRSRFAQTNSARGSPNHTQRDGSDRRLHQPRDVTRRSLKGRGNLDQRTEMAASARRRGPPVCRDLVHVDEIGRRERPRPVLTGFPRALLRGRVGPRRNGRISSRSWFTASSDASMG